MHPTCCERRRFFTVKFLVEEADKSPTISSENYASLIQNGLRQTIANLNNKKDENLENMVRYLLHKWETSPHIASYHQANGGNTWEFQGSLLALIKPSDSATSIHLAIEKTIIEMLLEHGAAKNQWGMCNLLANARKDGVPLPIASFILDHPDFTTPDDKDYLGDNYPLLKLFKNSPEHVGKLLDKGANPRYFHLGHSAPIHECDTPEQLALLLAACGKPMEVLQTNNRSGESPILLLSRAQSGTINLFITEDDIAKLTQQVLELASHYRLAHKSLNLSFAKIGALQSQGFDFKKLTEQYAQSATNAALKNSGIPAEIQEILAEHLPIASIHKLAHASKAVAHESKLDAVSRITPQTHDQPAHDKIRSERAAREKFEAEREALRASRTAESKQNMDNLVDKGTPTPEEGENTKSWAEKHLAEKGQKNPEADKGGGKPR